MSRPISIACHSVRCIKETDELNADEPYVITCVVDLSKKVAIPTGTITIPSVATTRTGVWADADTGEALATTPIPKNLPRSQWKSPFVPGVARIPCWDFDGHPRVIANPDDIIILVSMLEHDDTDTDIVRSLINSTVVAAVNGLANSNISREGLVSRLRDDMDAAIHTANATQPFNSDEQLGHTQELRLTKADIEKAEKGSQQLTLTFHGNGGSYRARYELRNKSFLVG